MPTQLGDQIVKLHNDTFEHSNLVNMKLKSFTTVATKNWTKHDGIAYAKRPLAQRLKNVWSFKIRRSKRIEMDFGVERVSNNHQFFVSLKQGLAYDTELPGN